MLIEPYNKYGSIRSIINEVAHTNTFEEKVTSYMSSFIFKHCNLLKHFSVTSQDQHSDLKIRHYDFDDDHVRYENNQLVAEPLSDHSIWELKRRMVLRLLNAVDGKNWHSTCFQVQGYADSSFNVVPRVYAILVRGEFIVFTEYNLEVFYDFGGTLPIKENIELPTTRSRYPLKGDDYVGMVGLYLSADGVKPIPIKNTYHPQFIAYKFSDEKHVFPIEVLGKVLSLNQYPPVRHPDSLEITQSFPNRYATNADRSIIINKLSVNSDGRLN